MSLRGIVWILGGYFVVLVFLFWLVIRYSL